MNGSYWIDFHHGWLIEVEPLEQGFSTTCYSPCRKHVLIQGLYASDAEAISAGKQQVNYQLACTALTKVLRELYEAERLDFADWRALSHSLH